MDKAMKLEILDMIKYDLTQAGFEVRKFKGEGYSPICLQVLGGFLLPSIFLFVEGQRLIFSRFMNIHRQKYSRGGLYYMDLANPAAKPSEMLLKLFGADAALKKSLRLVAREGF